MYNALTLKNRIMLACASKDPRELNNIFLFMRFKLRYDYEGAKEAFKKHAGISDAEFHNLQKIAHDMITSLHE